MDVAAFSDDNFEVKDWINKTFKSAEAQENRDAFVSSLVMKLQLYVQQVNSALEDTSQQVLQSLPRVMRDTEILHQEALLLRDKMHSVKQEIAKVEQDTGLSMATLEHIDRIKTELQASKQALHEADNWTILATDMEEVFESGDIENIYTKLVSMQQSLRILANVPDYEDRKLQLEGLKNRLEAMASPMLVQALTSASVEQSQLFVRIFTAIDRLPQLLKYYHKCQKGILMQQWRNIVEMEQDEGVAEWMHKFYDVLLSNWHDQVKWCGQVFTSAPTVNTLVDLYVDTLTSLDPSFNICIDAALKQQSNHLSFLMELQQITKHFSVNLQVAVDSASHGKPVNKEALAQAVYFPYVVYISKYAQYEQTYLSQQLTTLECSKDDLMDTIQSLGQSIPRVISIAVEANKRCLMFTEGCSYCGLMKALKIFISNFVDKYWHTLRQLDKQKGDREDWNMFQMCLTLLQNVGELLSQLKQLDRDLTRSLLDVSRKLNSQEVNSFVQYKKLLLSAAGQTELDALVSSIQEGEETLLIEHITLSLNKLCSNVHHTTFQVIFAPISVQLELVQSASANSQAMTVAPDLPDFSFAPQEYITQIGQYLMTLPQHLEPFMLQDNPSLTLALHVADAEYGMLSGETEGGFADVLLAIIARGTCQTYCDNILGICELGPSACKQLATDIDYLGNVLEDLGLTLPEHLQQLSMLLRLTPDEYQTKSSGCSPRLVAAVRQMRNITSS
ncbi:conserved oligomeric Golgi complex subunit 7 isoform X1 [Periplaneta americana]|uniref:conserved oligomeric Golgi complex subunit 7 isoform X1 n=2 Tax=Periplaneta americana TaxID=6978 RepID=UPI0037E9168C